MNQTLDLTDALEQIKAGAKIEGKDGVLAPLIKQLTEAVLQAELESHLTREINKNRKNGKSTKTMKSSVGEFELDIPRDRNGSYEPQIVKKHQTHMSDHIEQKILSLYALGNSYSQISEHIEEMYCRFHPHVSTHFTLKFPSISQTCFHPFHFYVSTF